MCQGWWWERAGILSDGGAEDEQFGWGVCAAAILRNLATVRSNLGALSDPECISLLVRQICFVFEGVCDPVTHGDGCVEPVVVSLAVQQNLTFLVTVRSNLGSLSDSDCISPVVSEMLFFWTLPPQF